MMCGTLFLWQFSNIQAFTTLIRSIKKRFEGEHVSQHHSQHYDTSALSMCFYLLKANLTPSCDYLQNTRRQF